MTDSNGSTASPPPDPAQKVAHVEPVSAATPWRHCFVAWARVLVLCVYPILGTVVAVYVVAFSDQGVDLLLDAMTQLSWGGDPDQQTLGNSLPRVVMRALLSGTSVVVAALSIWYPTRRLLSRKFTFYPIDADATRWLRTRLPRALAAAVPLGAAIGYLRLALRLDVAFAYILAVMWVLIAVGLVFVLVKRRAWLNSIGNYVTRRRSRPSDGKHVGADARRETDAGARVAQAAQNQPGPRWPLDAATMSHAPSQGAEALIILPCVAYGVLALAFAQWPVDLPRLFGGTALIFFGVGGLTFIATMLVVYLPLSMGSPTQTVLAACYILLVGTCSDNHGMRAVDTDVEPQLAARPAERAAAWARARGTGPCENANPVPALYVAAAGGGIRAAYWTARVMEELSLELGADFDCSLFALSGVSGGSLGIAAYVAANRDRPAASSAASASAPPAGTPPSEPGHRASRALGQDFFSPAVAGLLFYDALQRVIPGPIAWLDRSRGLEEAFQQAFDSIEGQPFRHRLSALDAQSSRTPMLFFNATIVEDGRRAIASNIDLSDFIDIYDLGCPRLNATQAPSTASISLASAVHNSARFTYVSPAGHVARLGDCSGSHVSDARVVDGGYFENSGAATLVQLLCALKPCDRPESAATAANGPATTGSPSATLTPVTPILLLIRNSPGTRPYCSGNHADDRCLSLSAEPGGSASLSPSWLLPEATSPVRALLAAREQRERIAVVAAAEAFRRRGGVVVEAYLPILQETLPEPPLGWSLSPGVRAALDQGARSIVAGCRETLKAVFSGGARRGSCDRPQAAGAVAADTTRTAAEPPHGASAASAAAR